MRFMKSGSPAVGEFSLGGRFTWKQMFSYFLFREMLPTLDIRRLGAFRSSWLWVPADVSYNEVVIDKCRTTVYRWVDGMIVMA